MFRAVIYHLLPQPDSLERFLSKRLLLVYVKMRETHRERYQHWLENELARLSQEFAIRRRVDALVVARNAAMESGIEPSDPRYIA